MADGPYLRIGVVILSFAATALLSACAKHPSDVAPATWSFSQAADGPELSATAVESSFKASDKDYAPNAAYRLPSRPAERRARADLRHLLRGRLLPGRQVGLRRELRCDGRSQPSPRRRDGEGDSAPLSQDLLSNAPGDLVVAGDTKPGVSQGGAWAKESSSTVVTRFDYGFEHATAAYVADVDKQARNFIGRLADSKWFKVSQGGAVPRFDTRALGAQ